MNEILFANSTILAGAMSGAGLAMVGAAYWAQRNSRRNRPGPSPAAGSAEGLPAEPRPFPERLAEHPAAMKLTLLPLLHDDVFRVRVDGPITRRGAGPEEDLLPALLGPLCYHHYIELDCQGAAGIDTSGVSWLTRTFDQFRAGGGRVVLTNVPPLVLDFLHFLSLETFFGLDAGPHPGASSVMPPPGNAAPARLPGRDGWGQNANGPGMRRKGIRFATLPFGAKGEAIVADMFRPSWLDLLTRAYILRAGAEQLGDEITRSCETLRRTRQFWRAVQAEQQRRRDGAIRKRLRGR
jgi:hypothetical protein